MFHRTPIMFETAKTSLFSWRGFLFLPILIFLSCATSGAVNQNPAVFSSIENAAPDWRQIAEGVSYFQGKISNPRIEFYALKIDLSVTRIIIKPGAENPQDGSVLSVKVSTFVRENNLAAGINALPFDVITAQEKLPVKNAGLVISSGKLLSPPNPNYDAIVFFREGDAAIVSQSSVQSIENIDQAAGGFHKILEAGHPAQRTENREDRHPRSAAGISDNGNVLYLLVIDGRRAASAGGTERETALLLRALGCRDGINLDGGGSSAMALRFPDGSVRTVNTPVHGGIPGRERPVAGCIGVSR
ncbi:MAG: phosphodiester glycosidase family protein [Treponema sp.]|nr:phosphodiester glycosidase family protein [Treponema sp.]MCL2272713.1 phosphodiester glycosidase family protein [Treponema sp.]